MKNITKLLLASAIALFIGCDGDVGNNTAPAVVKTEATQAVTVGTPTKVGDTGTTISVSEGTTFTDADGNTLDKAPEAKVAVEKSATKASTTINFEVDGKKVIPTEAVVISVPAPAGAKAGDMVQIEVPDDGSITEKLIFVLVKADGTVDVRVFPKAFTKTIVIVVETKKDSSTN